MLLPLVLFSFFVWYPMIFNVVLAFSYTDANLRIIGFAGFDHFRYLFTYSEFTTALLNTLIYAGFSILIGFLIPIAVALLLSEVVHFKGFFRSMFYMPSIISGVAVAILWLGLFTPGELGFLNAIFGTDHQFLNSSNRITPIVLIIITMTWRGFGATMLIYLASLQTVDSQQYEAAKIDGAGPLRRIRSVTLPHIIPLVKVLFVLQLISVFQVFVEPLVMTAWGGPDGASMSVLLLAFQYFRRDENSEAAAISVLIAVMIMAFTFFYLWLTRGEEAKIKAKQRKEDRKQRRITKKLRTIY